MGFPGSVHFFLTFFFNPLNYEKWGQGACFGVSPK